MTATGRAPFLELLAARTRAVGTILCVGLDPDPAELPSGFAPDVGGVERFARLVLDAAGRHAAAVKPNLAFWEALGPEGMAALERVRTAVPVGLPVLVDAKRGDIGPTAARQAVAIVDRLGADAVTLSPYLGRDAIEPFLARGAFAYVLCRTSNPSAGDVQDLAVRGEDGVLPLHVAVARLVESWSAEAPGVFGLVVGATDRDGLRAVREAAPTLPFLVPGVGAQGGDEAAALHWGPARAGAAAAAPGGALLVNVSRGITSAGLNGDPEAAIEAATRDWAARLRC